MIEWPEIENPLSISGLIVIILTIIAFYAKKNLGVENEETNEPEE